MGSSIRSTIGRRLPVVLDKREVAAVLSLMKGESRLMAGIIYGGGLRLQECLTLRVKDIDFNRNCLNIRRGKGDKDRQTIFSDTLTGQLKKHLEKIRRLFEKDRRDKVSGVCLPNALSNKYPNAGKEWKWYWVFPSPRVSVDPYSGIVRRHHIYATTLQKAVKKAVAESSITKHATVHTLRHYAESRIMPN